MSLVARDPFVDVLEMWDTFFNNPKKEISNYRRDPIYFETRRTKSKYYVRGVVPGFTESDLNITVRDRLLHVSGVREIRDGDDSIFSSSEREFQHMFELPRDAIGDEVRAEMENGILVISIPRWLGSEQEAREVPILKKEK